MSDNSAIEWTEATWNPVTGCTRISAGCANCYIERTMPFRVERRRFDGPQIGATTGVRLHPDRLGMPVRWRRPRRVFVNSLSDLFHASVPDEFIAEVFAVMAATPRHTFQLLTKRHGRMRALLCDDEFRKLVQEEFATLAHEGVDVGDANPWQTWPLRNVWLGVSCEDQQRADLRVPALLDTPAWIRWVSCEPLLGPIDLERADSVAFCDGGLDWVVAGGESGPGYRPVDLAWVRALRDQCTGSVHTKFLFKQVGGSTPKAGGRLLDGRIHDEMPGAGGGDADA